MPSALHCLGGSFSSAAACRHGASNILQQIWQAAGSSVSPQRTAQSATNLIWRPSVSLDLGWLHWVLRVCCGQGLFLHTEACQRASTIFPAFLSVLSYGMTLAWSLKPAGSRSLAYGNLSCCKWSEKSPDPQNLYRSLSEVQREDCAIATVYGIFSSSWPCGYDVCPACRAKLASRP